MKVEVYVSFMLPYCKYLKKVNSNRAEQGTRPLICYDLLSLLKPELKKKDKTTGLYPCYRARRRAPSASTVPEAQADPNSVLAVTAVKTRARVREEPLRGGSGTQGPGRQPQSHRNTGTSHLYIYNLVTQCTW